MDRPPVYGTINGQGSIKGTAFQPRNLAIEGDLTGHEVTVYGRPVKDIIAKVTGNVLNERPAEDPAVRVPQEPLGDGRAVYERNQGLAVGVRVPDLDLKEAGDLFRKVDTNARDAARKGELDPPLLGGTLDGQWTIDVSRPNLDSIRADGRFTAKTSAPPASPPTWWKAPPPWRTAISTWAR